MNEQDRKMLTAVMQILKTRFPNLTVQETFELTSDILIAVEESRE